MNSQQNRQKFSHYWERNSPELAESCQHEEFGQKNPSIIASIPEKHGKPLFLLVAITILTIISMGSVGCRSGNNSASETSLPVWSISSIATSPVGNASSSEPNYEEEFKNLPQWLQNDISQSTETQASVLTTCERAETFSALNDCAVLGQQACSEMQSVLTSLVSLSDSKVERLLNAWETASIRLCDASDNFSTIIDQN